MKSTKPPKLCKVFFRKRVSEGWHFDKLMLLLSSLLLKLIRMQTTTHPPVPAALPNSGTHKLPYGSYFPETVSFKVLVLLVCLLLTGAVMGQSTYFVKTTGNDAGSGTSWSGAFKTLQKALFTAGSGNQIWVAQGTYYPDEGPGQTNGDRNANFYLKDDMAIFGGFAGTETALSQRNWQ